MKQYLKHTSLMAACLFLVGSFEVEAQETEKSFIEHFNMPIEIGVSKSLGKNFDSGLSFKTCLEYRSFKNCGWFAALEYDEYDLGYKDYRFEGSNANAGTFSTTNWFLGGGYRFMFCGDTKKRDDAGVISLGVMLQPGVAFASVEKVAGTDPDFHLVAVEYNNFAAKASLQLDYLFSEYFGIYISEAYTQPFGHQLMRSRDSGVFTTSIGVTSFF